MGMKSWAAWRAAGNLSPGKPGAKIKNWKKFAYANQPSSSSSVDTSTGPDRRQRPKTARVGWPAPRPAHRRRSSVRKGRLRHGRRDDPAVAEQRLAQPHHLTGGALQAEPVLADEVVTRAARSSRAGIGTVADAVEFAADEFQARHAGAWRRGRWRCSTGRFPRGSPSRSGSSSTARGVRAGLWNRRESIFSPSSVLSRRTAKRPVVATARREKAEDELRLLGVAAVHDGARRGGPLAARGRLAPPGSAARQAARRHFLHGRGDAREDLFMVHAPGDGQHRRARMVTRPPEVHQLVAPQGGHRFQGSRQRAAQRVTDGQNAAARSSSATCAGWSWYIRISSRMTPRSRVRPPPPAAANAGTGR